MFLRIASIMCFAILSQSIFAQNLTFNDWDNDGDARIEEHEFIDNFVEYYYVDLDVTNDYGLDDEDFFHYTYNFIDDDGDGSLSDEEWAYAYDNLYADYLVNEGIMYYDLNDDGYLDYAEYYDVINDTDFYEVWDVDNDNYISQFELARAVFDNWDLNDSGTLSKGEYRYFDSFYLDI